MLIQIAAQSVNQALGRERPVIIRKEVGYLLAQEDPYQQRYDNGQLAQIAPLHHAVQQDEAHHAGDSEIQQRVRDEENDGPREEMPAAQ